MAASGRSMRKKQAESRTTAPRAMPPAAVPSPPTDLTIVGVGASAGGFEAFVQLLEAFGRNPRVAIVFAQHLAPHHASSLTSLLASHTPLPVIEVTDGIRVEVDHVYVVPPNAQMEL